MRIATEIQVGRAKNALIRFFEGKLYVPKIYFDAEWSGVAVDVLAIDRDGSGDVHTVLLLPETYLAGSVNRVEKAEQELACLDRFETIPSQYKWIARIRTVAQPHSDQWGWQESFLARTFAPDGLGRVGVLLIELVSEGDPAIAIELKAERFRAFVGKLADAYVAQHTADWEIRA